MWLLDFHSICHDACTPWALYLHISYTIETADNRNTDLAEQSPPSQPDAIQDHLDLVYLIVRRTSKRPVKPIGVTNRCIHLLKEQLMEKSYLFMWTVPRGALQNADIPQDPNSTDNPVAQPPAIFYPGVFTGSHAGHWFWWSKLFLLEVFFACIGLLALLCFGISFAIHFLDACRN
jgi:hypothetical protein